MITLHPTNLRWIKGDLDDPMDLCAHSPVEFRVGEVVFVRPEQGAWTVSAAALYLLRTLSRSHTKSEPVGDQLFPCCGHGLFDVGGEDVLILGCPNGVDVQVLRHGDDVWLVSPDGREQQIDFARWRDAVCAFSDAVLAFHASSSRKDPSDTVLAKGFTKFMAEWQRRRAAF